MIAASNKRIDIFSERKITPPKAANTGTNSCTVAAWVAVSPLNAAYQMTYPTPEANAPDNTASNTPLVDK
jgi:hypothetical protein